MPNTLEWEALEYEHFAKDARWYKRVMIAVAVLAFISLLFKNFLLAVLVLVGGFAVLLHGARLPETLKIKLTAKGLKINDHLYPYDRLQSFWLTDDHGEDRRPKLIVEADRFFLPHLVILLPEAPREEAIREYLLQYLPEVRREESFADILSDWLHF